MFLLISNNIIKYKHVSIILTQLEYRMFDSLLNQHRKNGVTYEDLLSEIWEQRKCIISLNTVAQLAHRLRKKFESQNIPIQLTISKKYGCRLYFSRLLIVFRKRKGLTFYKIIIANKDRAKIPAAVKCK